MAATLTIHIMGVPNYAQFGVWVHVGGTHVRAKDDHGGGTHNLLMGGDRLDEQNEPGGIIGGKDPTAWRRPKDVAKAKVKLCAA